MVGAQVVDPELLGPGRLAGRLLVEEEDVRLDPLGVEEAGGQAQQRVDVALVQELAADRLPGPALEQHVVRHDHGGAAVLLEQGLDVLDEVELLVGGGGPEVLALDDLSLAGLAVLGDDGGAALLAEGGIGEDHLEAVARVGGQRIRRPSAAGSSAADAVQHQVHGAEPRRGMHQLPALAGPCLRTLLLPVMFGLCLPHSRGPPAESRRCRRPDRRSSPSASAPSHPPWPGSAAAG